jgi:hypothetical protein
MNLDDKLELVRVDKEKETKEEEEAGSEREREVRCHPVLISVPSSTYEKLKELEDRLEVLKQIPEQQFAHLLKRLERQQQKQQRNPTTTSSSFSSSSSSSSSSSTSSIS